MTAGAAPASRRPRRFPALASALACALLAGGACATSRKTAPPTSTATVTPTKPPSACPAGACTAPPFSPTATATPAILLSEVFTDGAGIQWVELRNAGTASVPLNGWQLCFFPDYWPFPGTFTLAAGARVVVHWNAIGTNTALELFTGQPGFTNATIPTASGEMGLYDFASGCGGTFATPACLRDYLEWGSSGHTRSPTAVGAGVWSSSDFAPSLDGSRSLTLDLSTAGRQGCHYVLCAPSPGS